MKTGGETRWRHKNLDDFSAMSASHALLFRVGIDALVGGSDTPGSAKLDKSGLSRNSVTKNGPGGRCHSKDAQSHLRACLLPSAELSPY